MPKPCLAGNWPRLCGGSNPILGHRILQLRCRGARYDEPLHLTAGDALRPRLAQLAADVLRIPVADIHPAVPLAAMGLDSLAAAELTALIEDELSHELPPAMLFECPTLESLSRFIESRFAGAPIEERCDVQRDKYCGNAGGRDFAGGHRASLLSRSALRMTCF